MLTYIYCLPIISAEHPLFKASVHTSTRLNSPGDTVPKDKTTMLRRKADVYAKHWYRYMNVLLIPHVYIPCLKSVNFFYSYLDRY